jgi:MinD-like ATPase involved in chromosome partitioning or flagellar assembly
MTLVGVLSLKGAPGVTTFSCLLAATWPEEGSLVVVEADPAGGDLAGRFGLSSALGWSSLSSAVRRSGRATPMAPHLQYLPGGLPVLVSGSSGDQADLTCEAADVVERESADGLAVVDLGRRTADGGTQEDWLGRCDISILVVSGDAAAALHARARSARLTEATGGRLGVVVIGSGARDSTEVGGFTGIPALGDVPFDPQSAAVASGASGAGRRLERSALLAAVRRVADRLADRATAELPVPAAPSGHGPDDGRGRPASGPAGAPDDVGIGRPTEEASR